MAYENIRLKEPNFIVVDGYYYTMDNDTDSLIVKTDDGTQAYSYPLDSTLAGNNVVSLEHDGRNFWSLEANTGTIKRWYLDNYVCKLRNTYVTGYSTNAFTVDHYHTGFSAGGESVGQTNLSLKDIDGIENGDTVYLGPNSSGQSEERTVVSGGSGSIKVNVAIDYTYAEDDPVSSYHHMWIFDNNNGGKLHEYDPYGDSLIATVSGGEYYNVKAATFFDMYDASYRPGWSDSICYVKTTNLLFKNPSDLSNYGSASMDNVEDDQSTVIDIYDLAMDGTNIYRLQNRATYYGNTYTWSSQYNYQLSTTTPFITSISLAAEPAILPANGVNNSTITAIVKDQFNQAITSKPVYFTDDDPNGFITTSPVSTNANGEAQTSYKSGTTAREVEISATAEQS